MKMNWLPIAPDFGGDLRAALKSTEYEDCLEKLTSLAQYRLGFLETLQLGKALDRLTVEFGISFFVGFDLPSSHHRRSTIFCPPSVSVVYAEEC